LVQKITEGDESSVQVAMVGERGHHGIFKARDRCRIKISRYKLKDILEGEARENRFINVRGIGHSKYRLERAGRVGLWFWDGKDRGRVGRERCCV